MIAKWGASFPAYISSKKASGLVHLILLTPVGVDTGQFATLRQAKAMGVKMVLAGATGRAADRAARFLSGATFWGKVDCYNVEDSEHIHRGGADDCKGNCGLFRTDQIRASSTVRPATLPPLQAEPLGWKDEADHGALEQRRLLSCSVKPRGSLFC